MSSSSISAAATTGLTAPDSTPVADAMSRDILAIEPGSTLSDAARLMARTGVHGVAVAPGDDAQWRFVSDLDVVTAAAGAPGGSPRPAVTLPATANLVQAGRLMGSHGVSHVLVTDASGRQALGVVSALDVACHIAFGRPER